MSTDKGNACIYKFTAGKCNMLILLTAAKTKSTWQPSNLWLGFSGGGGRSRGA